MIIDIILIITLLICLITDLKERKIYNKVIFPALVLAFILNIYFIGLRGITFSLAGFAVGLAVLIIPYLFGGMGAGDVKLLALIGAFKGVNFVLNTTIYMALLGGAMALIIIICSRKFILFIKTIFIWIIGIFNGVRMDLDIPKGILSKTYPYGVAIVGGALICLLLKGAEFF